MAGDGVELPIFELPAGILPGELLPLHIFEERYKRMIGHCLEAEEPFGIVFRDEEGNAHRIGCMARVTEVLERFDDGRMNIVVAGEQPFRVLERFEGAGYPAGEVEPITSADEADEEDPEAADMAREALAAGIDGGGAHTVVRGEADDVDLVDVAVPEDLREVGLLEARVALVIAVLADVDHSVELDLLHRGVELGAVGS